MALLQLLYAANGNQVRLDARTKFKILECFLKGGGVKLVVHIAVAVASTPPLGRI